MTLLERLKELAGKGERRDMEPRYCCNGMDDAIRDKLVYFGYVKDRNGEGESQLYVISKDSHYFRLNHCPWCGEKLWDYPPTVEGGAE